ncbi:MAG: VOC family protein [Bacteroidota bacterium]
MQYAYTILYVENVTSSIEFYEAAFGFERKFITPENDYGELLTGATIIAFASLSLAKSNFDTSFQTAQSDQPPFGIELAFTTTEIEKDLDRALQAGAKLIGELTAKPWGQKVAYVRDSNGFLIEICTPMS